MKSGIYEILNISTKKIYIGSAVNITNRWSAHLCLLKKGNHHSKKLQNSWNKHGELSFSFRIIEYAARSSLIEREQFWIDKLNPWFNVLPTAGSPLGHKLSDKTKEKISIKAKGRKASLETRKLLSALRIGCKHSEATRLKISASGRLRPLATQETREKLRIAKIGKKLTPEHIEKTASKNRGRKQSVEQIANRVAAHLGKKRSDAAKLKMSIAQKNRYLKSDDHPLKSKISSISNNRNLLGEVGF